MNVGQVEFAVLADGLETVLGQVKELENSLNGMDGRKVNIGNGVRQVSRQVGDLQKELEHSFVNFGSRMQTLGRTMQNLTAPFNNIMRGFTYGIGYRALNKVIEGFSNAFSRADILNTTETILKLQGYDLGKTFSVGTQKAATAMENLDNAVQGLPTGLDEIVASMKVYVGASEDVEKSTRMAIAANNAYIASGVDATRKRYSERQLQNLMSGAQLTTQQWDSLRKNIPLAMNATAHELHMSMGDMITDLKNGRLETEKFIDAFIKVGTEGKIYESAQKLKITWDALSSNISIAFSRMGANILDTLNSVTKKATGRTFLEQLLGVDKNGKDMGDGIKSMINGISEAAQDWIKANPDKITGFLDELRSFDWKGMLGEIGNFFITIGSVYGKFIKAIGGKNLARFMLWGNTIGKFLTAFGGITRGGAGLFSRILTGAFLKNIVNGIKTIMSVGETVSAAPPISWQSVATKAIAIGTIPALAWSLKEAALALQEFEKVDISWPSLITKVGQAMTAITMFGTMAGGIGALISGTGPFGWAGAIAVGTGTAAIAAISGTMIAVAKGLNDISKVEVPDAAKLNEVISAISDVAKAFEAKNPFEAIGTVLDAWSKGSEFKTISKMAEAFKDIESLSKIKIDNNAMRQAKRNFKAVGKFINDLETVFSDENMKKAAGTTNGAGYRGNTNKYSNWQNQVSAFSNIINDITNAMNGMIDLVESAKAIEQLQTKIAPVGTAMKKLFGSDDPLGLVKSLPKNEGLDFSNVKRTMDNIAKGMYNLVEGKDSPLALLNRVSERTKGMNLGDVLSAFNVIPKIIAKMQEIGAIDTASINLSNLDTISTKISTFIQKITAALGTGGFGGGTQGFALNVSGFYSAVHGIKKAIGELNSIPMAKDMSAVVKSVTKAVNKLREIGTQIIDINITIQGTVTDNVGPKVTATAKAITDALDGIKKEYKKKVAVKILLGSHSNTVTRWINAQARSINAAVNNIPESITKRVKVNIGLGGTNDPLGLLKPHTGGGIGRGLIYRALGGFAFRPRGTDVIPAMLSRGEYVMQAMAARAIGGDVLQKLNHLDIAGAVQNLSARMGQNVGTINNTKNANLTINNYNAPSVGFVKGNRWVQSI